MTKATGKRIAFVLAMLCYLSAAGCAIGAALVHSKVLDDPLRGALVATALYLVVCGGLMQLGGRMIARQNNREPSE